MLRLNFHQWYYELLEIQTTFRTRIRHSPTQYQRERSGVQSNFVLITSEVIISAARGTWPITV